MTREKVQEVVLKNIRNVLIDLAAMDIPTGASLKDLGANSIDRADIVVQCLEDLQLAIPLVELRGPSNISGLVSLLYEKLQERPATHAAG